MSAVTDRIRRHLADPQSEHRKVVLGFLSVSIFVFIGKLAGAAKEMTIAWRYGVSETVDAYVFVLNLVSWPVSVWFSVLTVVMTPLIVRLGPRHERKREPRPARAPSGMRGGSIPRVGCPNRCAPRWPSRNMKDFDLIGAAGYAATRYLKAIKAAGNLPVATYDRNNSACTADSYFPEAEGRLQDCVAK